MSSRLFLAASLIALAAGAARATTTQPVVQTEYGAVAGTITNGVANFDGIPYATPPVGSLRWMPPTPPPSWTGVFQATSFGSQCAQPTSQFGHAGTNEDCLYLNVQTPAAATPTSKLPVIVWIHGGAFITGEGWDYDGTSLVTEGNVIVVTINYRLGLFGFLAHPALAALSPTGQTGNYGLLDQQAAVAWVRQNITNFGGNPNSITIFGEFAGGQSVLDQITAPGMGHLHGAIAESGAYQPSLPTLAEAEATYEQIVAAPSRGLNCTSQTAACLYALTTAQLVAAINPLTDLGVISPVVDGHVLPDQPILALYSGAFQRIPLMNGNNHDEWRLFTVLNDLLGSGPVTNTEYSSTLQATYGALAPSVAAAYPLSNFPSPDNANYAYSATITDSGFACGAHLVNAQASQFVPVYSYELNDPNAPDLFLPFDPNMTNTGDSHASELPYLFPLLQSSLFGKGVAQFTQPQLQLARGMRASWTSFARYARPLNPFGGTWAPYTAATRAVQSLISPAPYSFNNFTANHNCTLWKANLFQQSGLPATAPY